MRDDYELIRAYFQKNLHQVMKKPHSCFAYPFLDPGSIYEGNLWDWDTFWTVYAMANLVDESFAGAEFYREWKEHAKGNVLNFLSFQMEDGYIPMMVSANYFGEEEPYLLAKHRRGEILNMHKPFLCQQICLVSGIMGSYDWIIPHVEQLHRYFSCYRRYYYLERCGLYVWADDVMIGMDNDPASFGRPRFSTANLFLNCFMVQELRSMAQILRQMGDQEGEQSYLGQAKQLEEAIQRECWDPRDRIFYSVDVDVKTRAYDWFHKGLGVFWNSLPIKIRAWSSFLPLTQGIASREQGAQLVAHLTDPGTFGALMGCAPCPKTKRCTTWRPPTTPPTGLAQSGLLYSTWFSKACAVTVTAGKWRN